MCAQCAILAASVASGARSWVAARRFSWMTPKRLKLVTIALLSAGFVVSSVGFSGSTPPAARHQQRLRAAVR
jgi:hypothetical protein